MTPVQTAAVLGSLHPSHAETGGDLRVAELWWITHPTTPRRAAAPTGRPGARSQQGPGTDRVATKMGSMRERETRASGKFSSAACFSDGKCHLVQAKTIQWNVLILTELKSKTKKLFDKVEMVCANLGTECFLFFCGVSFSHFKTSFLFFFSF